MKKIPVVFDYETRSGRDIADGKTAYLNDPLADIVFLSYKIGTGDTHLWWPGKPVPACFTTTEPYHFYAFNAQFDWAVTNILGPKYGFKRLRLNQITDTMAICGRYSFPQGLDKALKATGLGVSKHRRGKTLMKKICCPPFEYTVKELAEFGRYCINDTDVLYKLIHALPSKDLSNSERQVWEDVVAMNMEGLPIDHAAVVRIHEVTSFYSKKKAKLLPKLTDGMVETAGQIQKIKDYCKDKGVELPNLTKATVESVLGCDDTPQDVRRVLELRSELAGAAIKKYARLKNMVHRGRIHDNLRYWGAGPGRCAGMGFQAQNLPRAAVPDPEAEIQKFFDTTILSEAPLQSAKALIRPMIRADKAKTLVCADYNSVEYILLMWWAGEIDKVEQFRAGVDPYKMEASLAFGIPYEKVTKAQRNEKKPVVLGSGYVMGPDALIEYSSGFGVDLEYGDAKPAITFWRSRHPMVVQSWGKLKTNSLLAVKNPGIEFTYRGVAMRVLKDGRNWKWLRMTLPSGRAIYYAKPKVVDGQYGEVVQHMGLNSTTKQWTHKWLPPNRLVENVIQGLGRDLMHFGVRKCFEAELNPILIVHDEVITHEDKAAASLDKLIEVICQRPMWCHDLPLKADGWVGRRYRKD